MSFCKCLEEQRLGEESEKHYNGREIVESHDLHRPWKTQYKEENVLSLHFQHFMRIEKKL